MYFIVIHGDFFFLIVSSPLLHLYATYLKSKVFEKNPDFFNIWEVPTTLLALWKFQKEIINSRSAWKHHLVLANKKNVSLKFADG